MFEYYDPTNLDGDFLSKEELSRALSDMRKKYGDSKDCIVDTLSMIEFYESKRREYILEGKNLAELDEEYLAMNIQFRDKHGDWAHHDNIYYDEFYNDIDEIRGG